MPDALSFDDMVRWVAGEVLAERPVSAERVMEHFGVGGFVADKVMAVDWPRFMQGGPAAGVGADIHTPLAPADICPRCHRRTLGTVRERWCVCGWSDDQVDARDYAYDGVDESKERTLRRRPARPIGESGATAKADIAVAQRMDTEEWDALVSRSSPWGPVDAVAS